MTGTLKDALANALKHWEQGNGYGALASQASLCCALVGLDRSPGGITHADAVSLLSRLRSRGLSASTVQCYYATFKNVLRLSGVQVPKDWPKAQTPPRRTRDELKDKDAQRALHWLRAKGWDATADLGVLLSRAGLRVNVEGRQVGNLTLLPQPSPPGGDGAPVEVGAGGGADAGQPGVPDGSEEEVGFAVLHVTGKGKHERLVPVLDQEALGILRDPERLTAIQETPYTTHLYRWNKGVEELGIKSRLATFHALRHGFASQALRLSGGNLAMVQELLGHSDPATTARYVHPDLSEKAKVLGFRQSISPLPPSETLP